MSLQPALRACPSCSFVNPPGMAFCGQCGVPLPASGAPPLDRQERRRLTVLFCDLVGSTSLSEQLELEEFEFLLRRFQETCSEVIRRQGGFVAHYMGDGMLVYFGYPRAMEGAPAQAVRAGLAILAAISKLEIPELSNRVGRLAVRIGVATGTVVVGDLVSDNVVEYAAVRGIVPNLAARLQAAAEPGTILLSHETQRSVAAEFELRDMGALTFRGLARPERVFQVLAERRRSPPVSNVAARFPGTPVIGRDRELASLVDLWAGSLRGDRNFAVIRGEPGIGKSRLVQNFRTQIKGEVHRELIFSCSANHTESAFYPIAAELRRQLGIEPDAHDATALARIEALADESGLERRDAVPLFAGMLLIDTGSAYPMPMLTPQRREDRLLEILAAVLRVWMQAEPLLAVIEDFQWSDPSSAKTILKLAEHLAGSPLLWIVTHRAEYDVAGLERVATAGISLDRLDRRSSARIAESVVQGGRLPEPVMNAILERADGVPLFIEELTKNAVEALAASQGQPNTSAVPISLQESLVARLDRMAHGKPVAQIASVVGRQFGLGVLARVVPMSESQLAAGMRELMEAGLVCPDAAAPEGHYLFRHALMRDTAYESLLLRVRRRLHRDIARVLAETFPALAASQPEVLAQHHTLGEQWEEAVDAWLVAGQGACKRLNLEEAIAHFRHGLALLPHIAGLANRERRELMLQAGLAGAWIPIRGYAAAEVQHAYDRAYELSGRSTGDPNAFPVVWGVWAYRIAGGTGAFGQEAADRLMAMADSFPGASLRMLAHTAQAVTRCARGDFSGCEQHSRDALGLYDPARDRSLAFQYTMDPKILTLLFRQHALTIQGRLAEAGQAEAESRAFARELGQAFIEAYVRVWGAVPLFYAGRYRDLLARLDGAVEHARVHRIDYWTMVGEAWRGAALIGLGAAEDGAGVLSALLSVIESTGTQLAVPFLKAVLARGHSLAGRAAEARSLAEAAAAASERAGAGMYDAEIKRMAGDVLAAQTKPDLSSAEAEYRAALTLARRQGALTWAMGAALSLARLYLRRDRSAQGLAVLEEAIGQVGSGCAPPGLEVARDLARRLRAA
ncbi:MAG: AAA family ATPase [Acetobacteraceae bacterium]|nr:AAA family ATPase [Acetobacteraceae bacterium]